MEKMKGKIVNCETCGAEFDASLVRCPYCGTAYEPAAEDEYMDKLCEKFILAYYQQHHPELHPKAAQVKWNQHFSWVLQA